MSTSLLYHAFRLRDYQYVKTEYVGGTVIFTIQRNPKTDCRAACGSDHVTRQSSVTRRFHGLPIGNRPVTLLADVAIKSRVGVGLFSKDSIKARPLAVR